MKKKLSYFVAFLLFLAIGFGVYLNINEQLSIDRSKIPEKVELSKGFQKWITNVKNKGFDIEADAFRLIEENEVYNTKWIKVYSLDEPGKKEELAQILQEHQDIKKVVFSPNDRELIDYRYEDRFGLAPNEARLYGQREDKILDARILDCSMKANCYFDRAYFLDNDVFVISEISRTIDKKDETAAECLPEDKCEYSFKLHVIDLINNKRFVYESTSFSVVLTEVLPEL